MYLNRDGKLVPLPSEDTLFSIEFHKGCVAFKVNIKPLLKKLKKSVLIYFIK